MKDSIAKRVGLARVLNKAGLASRSQCEQIVLAGRVAVNGKVNTQVEFPTTPSDVITLDGKRLERQERVYLALNKPRGLVTSASDEQGRDTVYRCLEGLGYGHVGPVGRLDKASEGLLLFTNDTVWADSLLDPKRAVVKCYHVKVRGCPTEAELAQLVVGISHEGEHLQAKKVSLLRPGTVHAWIEVELCEGKNREIRRMLGALGFETIRLVRVSIGSIQLGTLAKGAVRPLSAEEVASLL